MRGMGLSRESMFFEAEPPSSLSSSNLSLRAEGKQARPGARCPGGRRP